MRNKPELLMPAGNLDKLKTALMYKADAVYAGLPAMSLRMRVNQFDEKSLDEGIKYCHKLHKKIYITINIFPHNDKLEFIKKHLKWLNKAKPDGLIISDLGVFNLAKKYAPKLEVHISTQANLVNSETVKFWKDLGAKRVVLGRELSLKDIIQIHKDVPGIELECFVHGAMCMSYSGRCFLSMFLAGRDGNQGDCVQSCRWKFKIYKAESVIPAKAGIHNFFLEEEFRPNEFIPVSEDEKGTYIMSSKDLCMVEYLKDLWKAGVVSFKIEGRSKTENYVAIVSKVYRQAIDDIIANKKFDQKLVKELSKVANREFFTGFYFGLPDKNSHQMDRSTTHSSHKFIGIIKGYDQKRKLSKIEIRNRLEKGSEVEIVLPQKVHKEKILDIYNLKFQSQETAHGGVGEVYIKLKNRYPEMAIIRQICIVIPAHPAGSTLGVKAGI
jgi:U32 family peptidase